MDHVVDAAALAVESRLSDAEIIQLVDEEQLTQNQVLELAGGSLPVTRVPRPVVFALGRLSELLLAPLKRPSPLAVYRLKSALAYRTFKSSRAEELLGWKPRVGTREAIRRLCGSSPEPGGAPTASVTAPRVATAHES
jgi:nucleoside-diphosphate-sugar epimerase